MENVATPLIATPMFMVFFVLTNIAVCIALFNVRDSIAHLFQRAVGMSIATFLSIGVAISPMACLVYYYSAVY